MPEAPTPQWAHRPWPVPERRWIMSQRWHNLLFAHWPVEPASVRATLPEGLELDTFDGRAWIGLVPFRMSRVALRGVPRMPGAHRFPELNVRTYVRRGDRGGVWFYSLDAAHPLAVAVARTFFHLPYFRARMSLARSGPSIDYRSERTHRGAALAALRAAYRPTGPVQLAEPGSLDHWLTERYCLYTRGRRGRLLRGEIAHDPWPLQPAEAEFSVQTVTGAAGFGVEGSPHLAYAAQLDVRLWGLGVVGDRYGAAANDNGFDHAR